MTSSSEGSTSARTTPGPASHIASLGEHWSAGDSTKGGNADCLRMYPSAGGRPGPDHVRFSQGFCGNVIQAQPGQHLACAHITNADHVTIDRSEFRNCAQHDLELESVDGVISDGSLVENNIFAAPCSEQGSICGQVNAVDVGLGDGCQTGTETNLTVRFNSIDGDIGFNCGSKVSPGINVYAN